MACPRSTLVGDWRQGRGHIARGGSSVVSHKQGVFLVVVEAAAEAGECARVLGWYPALAGFAYEPLGSTADTAGLGLWGDCKLCMFFVM